MFLKYERNGNIYRVEVEREDHEYYISYEGDTFTVTAEEVDRGYLKIDLGGREIKCVVSETDGSKYVFLNGEVFEVSPLELTGRKFDGKMDSGAGESDFKSPISGKVVKVEVQEGDEVKTSEVMMVIEAMKMEYLIKAPWDGVIEKVNFSQGDQIEIGEETLVMSEEE